MNVFKSWIIIIVICIPFTVNAQVKVIRGEVLDFETGEKLIGASVVLIGQNASSFSNNQGLFQLSIPDHSPGKLKVSYVGYKDAVVDLRDVDPKLFSIRLEPLDLEEFVVQAERLVEIKSTNEVIIRNPSLLDLPSLKPDVDIAQIVQNQSGVQSVLEGATGFSVRGGNTDQNLILIDGIPIYNAGHFGAFVSIFDPFTINSLTFYKGASPSRFGGRASSVLDVNLKKGDAKSHHGEVKLGPIMSKISLEGPIQKDKSSYMISFRRSNADLLLGALYLINSPEEKFGLRFHDFTLKINTQINSTNKLFLTVYQGEDKVWDQFSREYFTGDGLSNFNYNRTNTWGNFSSNLRWSKVLEKNVFLNVSAAISNYNFDYNQKDNSTKDGLLESRNVNRYRVMVKDYLFKTDLEVLINEFIDLEIGAQFIMHDFTPVDSYKSKYGNFGLEDFSKSNKVVLDAIEGIGYIQGSYSNSSKTINLRGGIRSGIYAIDGNNWWTFEPRLLTAFHLPKLLKLNLDYSRNFQAVHSLNSSGTSLSPDIWIPATLHLPPVLSDLFSASLVGIKSQFSYSVGMYYKKLNNLIDINRNNGFISFSENWEESILGGGRGKAYGVEFNLERKFSRGNLALNYTYSRSVREFDEINNGREFPYSFDRPHVFVLEGALKLSESSSISIFGTLQSGQPFTISSESYFGLTNAYFSKDVPVANLFNWGLIDDFPSFFQEVLTFDNINDRRMPIYHRVDIAFSNKKFWKNGFQRVWNFSLYNVYNRKNAYFIYLNTGTGKFEKFTLMPILPSFSYTLKF